MSFRAELSIGSLKGVRVLHCSYALNRDIDPTGRPSSEVKGGTVNVEIESTKDTSLWELMIAQTKAVDGNVTFKTSEDNQTMKELKFEKAYLVQLNENFDSVGGNPMTLIFTLSAKKLTLGSESHENKWPA